MATKQFVISRRTSPGFALLLDAAAPFWLRFRLACFCGAISAATEVAFARLMQPFLDQGLSGNRGFPIWWVPAIIIGLFAVRGLASFLAQYGFSWVAQRCIERIRQRLFAQLQQAPAEAFRDYPASRLINVVIAETQTAVTSLNQAAYILVKDSLTLAGLLAVLFWLNWQLALVAFTVFPIIGWIISRITKRIKRLQKEQQAALDELAYAVEENALAARLVRLQNAQGEVSSRFQRLLEHTRRVFLRTEKISATGTPITQLIASVGVAVVLTIALLQAQSAELTVGSFATFITVMLMLLSPFKALSGLSQTITRAGVSLDRAAALLALASEQVDDASLRRAVPSKAAIEFDAVELAYTDSAGQAHAVLDRLCLSVPAGSTLALVGASGAGKTSLVNLLPGFVRASAGQVRVDGTPVAAWQLAALRSTMAFVSQDVVLFRDSIAANVCFGQSIDEARVWRALEAAQLSEFVKSLPQSLQHNIGHNGQLLSGGQRQRLAIARAIYKNAPILVLDEATSALDTQNERLVQSALENLMQGKTVIMIAHRLSTIERADQIAVLDQGQVVELGTHQDLLLKAGAYAALHALAAKDPSS